MCQSSASTLIISISYNAIPQNRSNCFLKPTIAIITRKKPGEPGSVGGTFMLVDGTGTFTGRSSNRPSSCPSPHPADSNRSSIWTGELGCRPIARSSAAIIRTKCSLLSRLRCIFRYAHPFIGVGHRSWQRA
jgi:hypothetical protein